MNCLGRAEIADGRLASNAINTGTMTLDKNAILTTLLTALQQCMMAQGECLRLVKEEAGCGKEMGRK